MSYLQSTIKNNNKTEDHNPKIMLPPKPSPTPISKPIIPENFDLTLKQLNTNLHETINKNENILTEIPVKQTIGKLGLMWPRNLALEYKASSLLHLYTQWPKTLIHKNHLCFQN
jgi:hypothetical protein